MTYLLQTGRFVLFLSGKIVDKHSLNVYLDYKINSGMNKDYFIVCNDTLFCLPSP